MASRLFRREQVSLSRSMSAIDAPRPQSQINRRNGHRCPVCAPRKRVLILAVPSPRLRGWPFRFFSHSRPVDYSPAAFLLSVDLPSRITVRLAPSDYLSLIQFLTSCDVLSNCSTRGERDYAN